MSTALNNITAPDDYNADATLQCGDASLFNLHVFNQPIYFKVAQRLESGSPANYGAEIYRAPGLYSMERNNIDAVAVRAAIPAAAISPGTDQAQVTIDAWDEAEL